MIQTEGTPFGRILRRLRRAAELTQEELAERAGLSPRTISDLERGLKVTPQSATVEQLAHALGLSESDRRALLSAVPRRRHRAGGREPGPRLATLPAEVTPLVGRERDEAAVVHLLRTSSVRLLTLIGPGGVGKTRLALRVAATLTGDFAGGAHFISLAPVNDAALVADAIALAVGVRSDASRSVVENLKSWLGEQETLLVLDNFEHVTDVAVLVSDLLAACSHLAVVVTSRSALHLQGEHLLEVPPLRAPAEGEPVSADLARRYSAVALFVQRAQAVRPDFDLTDEDAPAVAAICRRLDNLPLALELAAAQIRHMSPHALLRRLERGTTVLPRGPVDAPPRHQTMRDTIGWSYDLLDFEEQRLFRLLSVFIGGATLEAVEAVAMEAGNSALAILDSLVDKSLVQVLAENGGEPRFSMLETVREYSSELAAAHAETAGLRERHAQYYLAVAEAAAMEQLRSGPSKWSARLLADHPNLRSGLQWFVETGQLEQALMLAGRLVEYWIPWGYVREGRAILERLIEAAESSGARARIDIPPPALMGTARLASIQGDFSRAAALYEQLAEAHRRRGNARDEAVALSNRGTVAHMQTHYDEAVEWYERAVAAGRDAGEQFGMAMPLTNLGIIAMQRGEFEKSAALLDEALGLWRALGYDQKLAVTLGNRGALAYRQGLYDEAVALQEEALAMKQAMVDRLAVAHSLADLARAEIERAEAGRAGSRERAHDLLLEALGIFHEAGQRDGIAECLEGVAQIAQQRGELDRAVRLYAGAAAIRHELGISHHPADRERYERALRQLRAAMDAGTYRAGWKVGETMLLERLLRFAAADGAISARGPR